MLLETARLRIDDLTPADREDYFINISHDKAVLQTFICQYQAQLADFDFARYLGRNDIFAIREKVSGTLLGIFVECAVNEANRSLEIGYGLGSRHWGKGYMTEAVTAMLDYYLRQRGYRAVYASFFPENAASRRVMEKCGMTFSHLCPNELTYLGKQRDLVYYKIEAGPQPLPRKPNNIAKGEPTMYNPTAADVIYMKPRTGTALPQGALPAAIEYLTTHGTACWFLSAAPASGLLAQPEVAALGPLASLKLVQERDAKGTAQWAMYLRGPDMDVAPLVLPMEEAEVQRILQANGLALPVPQPMAIDLAPAAAPDAPPPPDDQDAPPFEL